MEPAEPTSSIGSSAAEDGLAPRLRPLLLSTLAANSGVAPPDPALPYQCGPPIEAGGFRYELVRSVARGRQASVWEGRDRLLSSPERPVRVAIKLFPALDDEEAAAQALAEARSLRTIRHPRVVTVFDAGRTAEGWPFLVEDFLDAMDLATWRQAHPASIRPQQAIAMIHDIGDALGAVHEAGFVHCDLSPGNVLVRSDGRLVLADFGCAWSSGHAGPATGTPAFMPAERWAATVASPRADVAALAGLLHWLLTTDFPYGTTFAAIEAAHADPSSARRTRLRALRQCRVDRELTALIERGLDSDPQRRFPSASAFVGALDAWLTRRERRRRHVFGLVAAGLAIATLVLSLWYGRSPRQAPSPSVTIAAIAHALGEADAVALHQLFAATGNIADGVAEGDLAAIADWSASRESRLDRLAPNQRTLLASEAAAVFLEVGRFDDAARWLGHAAFALDEVRAQGGPGEHDDFVVRLRALRAAIDFERSRRASEASGSPWPQFLLDAAYWHSALGSAAVAWPTDAQGRRSPVRLGFERRAEILRQLPLRP